MAYILRDVNGLAVDLYRKSIIKQRKYLQNMKS